MKAMTLWQPWATLVILGEKEFETRSWSTEHRGVLAVHAGKVSNGMSFCTNAYVREVFQTYELRPSQLPFGYVLGLVKVIDVFPAEDLWGDLEDQEKEFGNFGRGRFAWELEVAEMFEEPILARGQQGLWDWEGAGYEDARDIDK